MLKVFFMAVLSLNLAPYSIQDVRSTSRPSISNSTSTDKAKRVTPVLQNQTSLSIPTSFATSSSNFTILPSAKKVKKKRVIKRKRKSKSSDNAPAHSHLYEVKTPTDLQTKSDMQILQYYAQPLNTIDLNVQPVSPYEYDSMPGANAFSSMNQNLFVTNSNYMTAMPTLSPTGTPLHLPYKTLPEFGHPELAPKPFSLKHINYNWNQEAHHFKPLPILDPFNLYKRPRPQKYRGPPVHAQKIIATAKPVTSSVSMLPPVSVTHVYKYTDDNGLKIPFLQPDDSLDDSIPILSAALNDHLHERITNVGMKNYLTPPKIGQPFLYNMPHITLSPLNNELELLNKYNAELQTQIHQSAEKHPDSDEVNETQEEKNYTDDDVKKALEYIQSLKKDKGKQSRGSKKYRNGDELAETKSSRKAKKHQENTEYEDEDEDEGDGKRGKRRRRKKPRKEHIFEEEDDFQLDPFDDDRTQEESQKNIVKAERQDHSDHVRSQESQIVPSVEDENAEFNFEGNVNIGNGDSDDRVEFQMHGLKGPESYKFGYDTGKGYEERDPDGRVKGHFGYYDKDGKLQVFNYEADPEHGYHLEKASE